MSNMSKKKAKDLVDPTLLADDEGGGGGQGASTHRSAIEIMGAEDTRREDLKTSVIDAKGQKVLAKYSMEAMGNMERQARKGKERLIAGRFGKESTKEAIKERLKNTEKAPQHSLGNVLGLGRVPGPGAPRPR